MVLFGNQVKCLTCGYTSNISNKNVLFYKSKYRRKLLDNLDNHYTGYLEGSCFFADVFFSNHYDDYIKTFRYWATNKPGGKALIDYITSKHDAPKESFAEFMMYPLRNYLKSLVKDQQKSARTLTEINDLFIKLINSNYIEIKNKFCINENIEYLDIWTSYIRFLLKSIICPITSELLTGVDQTLQNRMTVSQKKHLLNAYIINVSVTQNKIVNIYLDLSSMEYEKKGVVLRADIAQCNSNIHIGQALISVILKYNLHHLQSLKCVLTNGVGRIKQQELLAFLKDLLPMVSSIELV